MNTVVRNVTTLLFALVILFWFFWLQADLNFNSGFGALGSPIFLTYGLFWITVPYIELVLSLALFIGSWKLYNSYRALALFGMIVAIASMVGTGIVLLLLQLYA